MRLGNLASPSLGHGSSSLRDVPIIQEDAERASAVALAGSMRGTAVRVAREELRIGTSPDVEIRPPHDLQPPTSMMPNFG